MYLFVFRMKELKKQAEKQNMEARQTTQRVCVIWLHYYSHCVFTNV